MKLHNRAILSRFGRLFDWRMVASIAFLLLVVLVLTNFFHAVHQDADKTRRIDDLVSQAADADREAASARDTSAAAREKLLRQQARLLRQAAALQHRFVVLIAYLNQAGVSIPPGVFPGGTNSDPTTPSSDRAVTPMEPSSPTTPTPQPTSGPTTPPMSPAPNPGPTPTSSPSPTSSPTTPPVTLLPPVCVLGLCV